MGWLKRLFGIMDATSDRVAAAGERIATAAEEMAAEWEQAREAHRLRFGAASEDEPAKARKARLA